jgi:hypothetical protein
VLQINEYDLPDLFEVQVYRPIDWSPSGRYLQLEVGHYEGGSRAILDMETRQLFHIPNTFSYTNPAKPYISWMQDNGLLLVRAEGAWREFTNILEIWRPVAGNGQWVVEDSVDLPISPRTYVTGLAQFASGSLAFGIVGIERLTNPIPGLYWLDSLHSDLQPMNQIPWLLFETDVYWAPDGSGAVVDVKQLAYVAASDSTIYSLRPLVGLYVSEVRWLP